MSRQATLARRLRALRALGDAAEGIAVVEFAFVATFMVLLYLGSMQLSDAIFANRKVTTTTRAITDLTTQYSVLTDQDMEGILDASAKLLTPYASANAQIRVSQIHINSSGVGKIAWSRARGTGISKFANCAVVDIPEELKIPDSSLIYGEVNYTHTPTFAAYSVGTIKLSDQIFMLPRVSSSVSLLSATSEETECS